MILRGKTLKGKNRIRELGEVWFLDRKQDSVLFSSRPGPWGFVFPKDHDRVQHSRWIHLESDLDFEIVEK